MYCGARKARIAYFAPQLTGIIQPEAGERRMPNRTAAHPTSPTDAPSQPDPRRAERRPDAWGDFLRRMLLSAGLASAAAVTASAGQEPPPAEIAEAESPQPELPAA
jgi:hypothetical protein